MLGRALLIAAIVFASRLPFLGPGYGVDADAWRVAWAGRAIAETGHYEASRLPGYPLQELAQALIWRWGPAGSNAVSALFSAAAAACFALVLRRLGSRDDWLAALALAFAPVVYGASVQSMDFVWGLAFALAALALALRRRAAWAGIAMGLAIGCRITWGAFLVPLSLVLVHASPPNTRIRSLAIGWALALATGGLLFAPVVLRYGASFFRFYPYSDPGLAVVVKHATVDLLGIPGLLALAAALGWWAMRRGRPARETSIPGPASGWLTGAWVAGIALYAGAYLRIPIDAAYLIPALPLLLLWLAQRLDRRAFQFVCMALIVSPWLFTVSRPAQLDAPRPAAGTVAIARGALLLDLRGPILTEHARRQERERILERAFAQVRGRTGETVVVAWEWLPEIRVQLGGTSEGHVRYVYDLTLAELEALQRRDVHIAYLPGADWGTEQTQGFDLASRGAVRLR